MLPEARGSAIALLVKGATPLPAAVTPVAVLLAVTFAIVSARGLPDWMDRPLAFVGPAALGALIGGALMSAIDERGVDVAVELPDRADQLRERLRLVALEAGPEDQVAHLEVEEPEQRVEMDAPQRLRFVSGDLLDIHAARRRRHENDPFLAAIHERAEIQFAGNIRPGLHQHGVDRQSLGTRLVGDEGTAEHLVRVFSDLVVRSGQLDAAGFAATSCMNLRLDDPELASQFLGCFDGCIRRVRRNALGYGDAVVSKQPFRLIFVEIHYFSSVLQSERGFSPNPPRKGPRILDVCGTHVHNRSTIRA
mgnify:CR=1 FL=1